MTAEPWWMDPLPKLKLVSRKVTNKVVHATFQDPDAPNLPLAAFCLEGEDETLLPHRAWSRFQRKKVDAHAQHQASLQQYIPKQE